MAQKQTKKEMTKEVESFNFQPAGDSCSFFLPHPHLWPIPVLDNFCSVFIVCLVLFFPCRFEIKLGSFHVTGSGSPDHSAKPRLLSSLNDATSLFQIIFEINPLDETVAQRFILEAEPVEIIYDAVSHVKFNN